MKTLTNKELLLLSYLLEQELIAKASDLNSVNNLDLEWMLKDRMDELSTLLKKINNGFFGKEEQNDE